MNSKTILGLLIIGLCSVGYQLVSAGTVTRTVLCKNQYGVTVSDSFCSGTKPAGTGSQVCDNSAPPSCKPIYALMSTVTGEQVVFSQGDVLSGITQCITDNTSHIDNNYMLDFPWLNDQRRGDIVTVNRTPVSMRTAVPASFFGYVRFREGHSYFTGDDVGKTCYSLFYNSIANRFVKTLSTKIGYVSNTGAQCGIVLPRVYIPVNGACGSDNLQSLQLPPTNLCSSGTPSGGSGDGPWSWICNGSNGGTNEQCTANLALRSGVCGRANGGTFSTSPTTRLCRDGVASAVAGTGPWSWSCLGTNGNSASCSASITPPGTPVCGPAYANIYPNVTQANLAGSLCTVGNPSYSPLVGAGPWSWSCTNAGVNESCGAHTIGWTCDVDTTVGQTCFIADTMVTMADGSQQPIQDIKAGDKLKGLDSTNTVLSLINPKLGNQKLYGFNGGKPFVTSNHPFLTTKGWKSLDPDTTKKEIPDLEVSLLSVGDVFVTDQGSIRIGSIVGSSDAPDTQLYNFNVDGDHTYYANGFVVHNKELRIGGTLRPDRGTCNKNSDCRSRYQQEVTPAYCNRGTNQCTYTNPGTYSNCGTGVIYSTGVMQL